MSDVSFMEMLLDGVEVEWKALGEVCDFKNGFAFKSSLFKEAGLPIVRITNVDGKNISLADVKYFDPSDYKENTASYEVTKGDILIAMSGATTGKIGFYTHENPAYLNQRVGKFLPKPKILNNRYLYHYLLSKVEQIYVIAGGGAQPNLSSNALMAKIQIPIPCPNNPQKSLEIQAEIVRILDAFTAMTAELTAELNLRKKQYNYYRDQLLSFEEGEAEWKTLEHLCASISAGGDVPKNSSKGQTQPSDEYPYPIYANATDEKGLYGFTDDYKIDSDAVTISARGAKVGYHTVREAKFTPIIRLIVLVANKRLISTRYLNYVLDMTPIGGTEAGIPQLTVPMVKKLQFQFLSLMTQIDHLLNKPASSPSSINSMR
ncbi:restriction endonuclease subunit S [Saccharophagus degradans]|nr:restriction endonuclease subunit S [Saccharophagus degradans]WGO99769.1 restriction endonuclease subunit S [Saccharophagus degradans]